MLRRAAILLGVCACLAPVVARGDVVPVVSPRLPVIVTFRSESARAAAVARFGDRPGIVLRSLPVLAFTATAPELASLSGVVNVEPDEVHPVLLPSATIASRARAVWGTQDGGPLTVGGKVVDGSGIGIAIIDSGIDASHPDLRSRVKKNVRVASDRLIGDVYRVMFGANDPDEPVPNDQFVDVDSSEIVDSHGTHVSGIALGDGTASDGRIKGVAPGASLYGFGAGASRGVVGSYAAAAFDWILQNHAKVEPPIRVLNNSWGTVGEFDPDTVQAKLATALVRDGVVITWGAGNGDPLENGGTCTDNRLISEAQNPIPGLISVANYDDLDKGTRDGMLDSSSSRGRASDPKTWPDISAPGMSITSALHPASDSLAIAALGYAETFGDAEDSNPPARPFGQHKGTVAFRFGGQRSTTAPIDWTTWTAPVALYEAHHTRFGNDDPRLFNSSGDATGPVVSPSDSAFAVQQGDTLFLTKETGATNPVSVQVTSPSGTSKTFYVDFTCGAGSCGVGLISFAVDGDYHGVGSIDLFNAFGGEPADGTWTITPGPMNSTVNPFNPYYVSEGGTSMAAPHVAGVVALMLDANPALTPGEVENIIEDTAHKFAAGGPFVPDPANPDSNAACGAGHGLVDARSAVDAAFVH